MPPRGLNVRLAMLFLSLALPMGLLLAAIVPLGQVPDERAHVLRADSLLRGELIGHREIRVAGAGRRLPTEGVVADDALSAVILPTEHLLSRIPGHVDAADLAASRRVRFGRPGFHELGPIAGYFPVFYVPGAAALGMAKILRAGAFDGFTAVRLCNLAIALGLETAALLLAARGRTLLFTSLLLPANLSLAASANQDGLLIAATALAAALAGRLGLHEPPGRSGTFRAAALLIGCVGLAKPPYVPLVVLLFLPLRLSRRAPFPPWLGTRIAVVSLILLAVAGWTWFEVHQAAAPVFGRLAEAGPLWTGRRPAVFGGTDLSGQLSVLSSRPWRFVTLPLATIWHHPEVFVQLVGVLGWLNLVLPAGLMLLWAASLGGSGLADMASTGPRDGSRAQEAALLLAAVFIAVLLIYISQYLSFTPVGWDWIAGPQGRYLIPLLPILALALPTRRCSAPAGNGPFPRLALLLPIMAAVIGLYALPAAAVALYYTGR